MSARIVTFTNLFPSAAFPNHGVFVRDRMQRVVARLGVEWTVVCPVPEAPWPLRRWVYRRQAAMPAEERVGGVQVLHPRYRHLPGLGVSGQARAMARGAAAALAALVRRERCVVDAHYAYPDGVAAAQLAASLGVPFTITARGTDVNVLLRRPALQRQIRACAPGAGALFAVSEALRRAFVAVAGVPDAAVLLARNGVDLERFRPGDRAAARAALGLPDRGPLVLGVGRLVRAKGFHDLLAALRDLPGATLVLVGEGPERHRLERRAPAGRLLCLGPLPQARLLLAYQACDVLALPSQREGWPNVITEALACGVPVVAYAAGGIPEILTDPSAC